MMFCMSRYPVTPHDDRYSVDVGWDAPMKTYFAQVEDLKSPDDHNAMVLWMGAHPNEIQTVQQLQDGVAPYATIPKQTLDCLAADRTNSPPARKTTEMRELARAVMKEAPASTKKPESFSR